MQMSMLLKNHISTANITYSRKLENNLEVSINQILGWVPAHGLRQKIGTFNPVSWFVVSKPRMARCFNRS